MMKAASELVTSNAPSPPLPFTDQTPAKSSSTLFQTSEEEKLIDIKLKNELKSSLYVDVPGFFDAIFSGVPDLQLISEAVFKKCQQGRNPLFRNGRWRHWPHPPDENRVLDWLKTRIDQFLKFARMEKQVLPNRQRMLAKRKLDVG